MKKSATVPASGTWEQLRAQNQSNRVSHSIVGLVSARGAPNGARGGRAPPNINSRGNRRASFPFAALLDCAFRMISEIEPQAGGTSGDLVEQVEKLFSPEGILSRAKNFEYRPQQQRMAVAVARALENREHLVVEAGTGVGKSLAYLAPGHLARRRAKAKRRSSPRTPSICRSSSRKKICRCSNSVLPVEVQLHDAQRPRELSLHAPPAKGDAAGRQPFHLAGGGGTASASTNGPRPPRTAACRILRSSRT